ncbi:hypothetical protein [Nocardioides pacificus]
MSKVRTRATTLRLLGAGTLLANAVPHGVKGLTGQRFPSPFARPPGVGLSSPLTNVAWSTMNLAAGALLLRGGATTPRDRLTVAAGATGMAFFLAHYFGSLEGER